MPLNHKKILFIHPLGYRKDAAGQDISRIANLMPPLGLASMAAYLQQKGMKSHIIDCFARPDSDRRIVEYLESEKPAFIGFSCTTSSFLDAVHLAKLAKQALPGIQTVFGGPHVSALKTRLLEDYPAMDFGIIGEGEESLFELMSGGWECPKDVQGLAYRDAAGQAHFNGYRSKALELDSLPFPAYEKLEGFPDTYKLPIFNYPKTPNTSCISSRGCPYACSYCDRSVFQRSFRFNSAEYLYEHMRYLKNRFGIRHINFYDDQFTLNRSRIEALTEKLIREPLGMTYNCAVRAEHIDEALVKHMRRAGCWMMSLGIETGDPELLAQHRQNPDLDFLAQQIRMIKAAGIRTKGLLMIGLPGESRESIKRSMDYVFSLPIDDFNLAKFTPFPGSPIYEKIHELGTFDEDWEKMDCMNFQFITHGMTRDELENLFKVFYQRHFSRNKVLLGYAAMLWKSPDSWLRFVQSLGSFLKFTRQTQRIMDENPT